MVFDQTDAAQAAFVEQATRYYQIFDARTGELIVQSDALRPLGLEFTPAEVRQFRERPTTLDLNTDYGRIRLSNSVLTPAASRTYLQVGASLGPMDGALKRFLILLVMSVPAGLVVTFVTRRCRPGGEVVVVRLAAECERWERDHIHDVFFDFSSLSLESFNCLFFEILLSIAGKPTPSDSDLASSFCALQE